MLILTVKSFDLSELTLRNPETSNGVMFCDVSLGNDPLYVQTPRMTFEETSGGIRLFFGDSSKMENINIFYGMLRDIEAKVCEILSAKSGDWFQSPIPLDTIKNSLFRNCIQLPMRIGEPLSMVVGIPLLPNGDRDIEIFDTSRRERSYQDLLGSKECTFLLTAKELSISSTQANIVWELVQVLTHPIKKKVKGFGIRTEHPEYEKLSLGLVPTEQPKDFSMEEEESPKESPSEESPKETV